MSGFDMSHLLLSDHHLSLFAIGPQQHVQVFGILFRRIEICLHIEILV